MDSTEVLQQAINGLTLGLLYALIALGYTLVYGVLQLINFAHGEIMMFGAFYSYAFMEPLSHEQGLGLGILGGLAAAVSVYDRAAAKRGRVAGAAAAFASAAVLGGGGYHLALSTLPLTAAVALALPFAAVLAMALERLAYRPLRRQDRLIPLISAIGASLFLQNLAQVDPWFFGTVRKTFRVPEWLRDAAFTIGDGVRVSNLQLVIFVVAISMMAGLYFFISFTRMGTAMRAASQNRRVASLMGIDTDGVIALTFALGAVLATGGGVLYAIYLGTIYPYIGYMAGIKAFTAAVLGGIGNVPGAMVGGVLLGLLESLGAVNHPEYKDAIAFIVLILVLLVKPSGILGKSTVEKI